MQMLYCDLSLALTSVLSSFRLAQEEMQQQNVIDAMREAQKPLARHIDDEDLDRMLREQERDGDPMAAMLRKKKDKNAKLKGIKGKCPYLQFCNAQIAI